MIEYFLHDEAIHILATVPKCSGKSSIHLESISEDEQSYNTNKARSKYLAYLKWITRFIRLKYIINLS